MTCSQTVDIFGDCHLSIILVQESLQRSIKDTMAHHQQLPCNWSKTLGGIRISVGTAQLKFT